MKIVYVGDAGDFHVRDKIVHLANVLEKHTLSVFSGVSIEAFDQGLLDGVNLTKLSRLDLSLFASSFNNQTVRNVLKALCYPINITWLFFYKLLNRDAVFHAFTMYYIFLNALVGKGFIATPQASEVIHRMVSSKFYRKFALFSLSRAAVIIVDSKEMQMCIQSYGLDAIVHKNGFDTELLRQVNESSHTETKCKLVSLRGIRPLYRIKEIVEIRNKGDISYSISFVYPGEEHGYKQEVFKQLKNGDEDLGMLDKQALYKLLSVSLLCISIPESDSSPRSVYEAIFCGSIVAVSRANYIKELPTCMKSRLIIVDLSSSDWLQQAVNRAKKIGESPYIPSNEALEMCDSKLLYKKLISSVYQKQI